MIMLRKRPIRPPMGSDIMKEIRNSTIDIVYIMLDDESEPRRRSG